MLQVNEKSLDQYGHPQFDYEDLKILGESLSNFDKREGPRVGDFCEFPNGELYRFSHDWGDSIQISKGGSYYLCKSGHVSMSGSLEPAIDKNKFEKTHKTMLGSFWFFHHNHSCAHNGVYFKVPCRVYKLLEDS